MKPFLIIITLLGDCSELVCPKVNLQRCYSFFKKAFTKQLLRREIPTLPCPYVLSLGPMLQATTTSPATKIEYPSFSSLWNYISRHY